MKTERQSLAILLDEAYLFILTRRPTAVALARGLRISEERLDEVLRRLSASIKKNRLRVSSLGRGKGRVLEIRSFKDPAKPVDVDSSTLGVRRLPPRRPGLKPEDEIIYMRDW